MKLTAEQRIERCHIDLMNHPNFVAYSGILMIGSVKVDDTCPTAYTNGRDVVYGRGFVETLSEPELRGVILHENKHKMYRHIATWHHLWKQNQQKANMACDYVINLKIADENQDGFAKPPEIGLCMDEKYRDWDSARVFNDLMKQAQEQPQGGSGGGKGDKSGGMGNGKPLDAHGWEEAQEMDAEEPSGADKVAPVCVPAASVNERCGPEIGPVHRASTAKSSRELQRKSGGPLEGKGGAVRAADTAWASLTAAEGRLKASAEGLQAADLALKGVRAEYGFGLRTTVDILVADQSYRSAQLAVARAQVDVLTAQAALLRATGRMGRGAFE